MAELQIDSDWKKAAQEEKRKLAEREAAAKAKAQAAPAVAASDATPGTDPSRRARGERDAPPASFASLVQQLMTQVLLYLGEIAVRGGEGMVDLDMARRNIDLLGVLDEKTQGNLTPEERQLLDVTLYETRQRFVGVASQYL